jgi:hypothetical protein
VSGISQAPTVAHNQLNSNSHRSSFKASLAIPSFLAEHSHDDHFRQQSIICSSDSALDLLRELFSLGHVTAGGLSYGRRRGR